MGMQNYTSAYFARNKRKTHIKKEKLKKKREFWGDQETTSKPSDENLATPSGDGDLMKPPHY